MEYAASLRVREMAIRSSLGAPGGALVALLARDGAKLLAAGILFGLAGTYLLRQSLLTGLPEIKDADASSVLTSVAVVGLAALAAIILPARSVLATEGHVMLRLQ
jgi:ABC-type antimicrobial peptide transport system permease subunit